MVLNVRVPHKETNSGPVHLTRHGAASHQPPVRTELARMRQCLRASPPIYYAVHEWSRLHKRHFSGDKNSRGRGLPANNRQGNRKLLICTAPRTATDTSRAGSHNFETIGSQMAVRLTARILLERLSRPLRHCAVGSVFGQLQSPMISLGTEPAIFRLAVQGLSKLR
jgi:hypothetical protein